MDQLQDNTRLVLTHLHINSICGEAEVEQVVVLYLHHTKVEEALVVLEDLVFSLDQYLEDNHMLSL
jgi:hypothetical protein